MTNLQNLQNLEGMNFSDELQYAVECGVKFDVKALDNGDIQVSWNSGKCVEILSFEFDTDIEEVQEVVEVIEQEELEVVTVEEIASEYNLTDKEIAVLNGLIKAQFEDGLPPFTLEIAHFANLTERQTVGVISSLYKKGFVESYGDNERMINCKDMYHLTSEWFEKFKGYL